MKYQISELLRRGMAPKSLLVQMIQKKINSKTGG
jgi:hypothetical protein